MGGYLAELETTAEHRAVVNLLPVPSGAYYNRARYFLGANSFDNDNDKFKWVRSNAEVPDGACWQSLGSNNPSVDRCLVGINQ